MSAQAGDAVLLAYGPQGARQAGDAVVLSYTPTIGARTRVSASMGARWGAGAAAHADTRAPSIAPRASGTTRQAAWGRGAAHAANARSAWVAPRASAQHHRTAWAQYLRSARWLGVARWVEAARRDAQSAAPWGAYSGHLQPERLAPWVRPRVVDWGQSAPWGAFAGHPVAVVSAAWVQARLVDSQKYLPWSRYSRALDSGWGVVPGGSVPGEDGDTVVVPVRRVYMTVNSVSLRRVVGDVALPCESFSMSIDVDSWTWSWSASLPEDAAEYVMPVAGVPTELEVVLNGVPYRLVAETMRRERSFLKARLSVGGRGKSAMLDDPYAPVLTHANTSARTAQQLLADALTLNGAGTGWDVEFGLTDWLVPAGAWSHQGTAISAINAIVGAVGGYVQPHPTAQTLRVLPRYPSGPWGWAALAADYELPFDVVSLEGVEWVTRPAYNRVHVSGVSAGILAEATRDGTAGDVVAPMVSDQLITHADAASQRALQVLSDVGEQARISLKLPVLASTGIITPGKLVRYLDGAEARTGLVRATAVDWARPVLRQTIEIETHAVT